jgi:excisionase family DNA binding protein
MPTVPCDQTSERATLTLDEAADLLGVHRQTVGAAIRRGELPVLHVGRRVLIPVDALRRLLACGDTKPAA